LVVRRHRNLSGARALHYHFPDWSPDGKRIVLRVASAKTSGLAILEVDSGRLTPLTSDAGMDNLPKWSPKRDLIVITSNFDGDWELYTIRPDGTGVKRLTTTPGNDAHAAWSPDGRWPPSPARAAASKTKWRAAAAARPRRTCS
jgi:Tol biopolymer transport system component